MTVAAPPLHVQEPASRSEDAAVPSLELFVRRERPDELHLYALGFAPGDFAALFEREIRPRTALLYRIPPDLLNPNYWEPLTQEAEGEVRAKRGGLITRTEGDQALVWRSDRVPRSRLLRDGLDEVPVELLGGYVLRTPGEGFLRLARAWSGRGRFEVVLLTLPLPEPKEILGTVHQDLVRMTRSLPGEQFLFATQDDGLTRAVFAETEHFLRALEAILRRFVAQASGRPVARIGRPTLERLADLAEGCGFSAAPADVHDKGRTLEVRLRRGRTPWGVAPDADPDVALEHDALLYYDRTAGLWASCT
jgi:hypothetical protein